MGYLSFSICRGEKKATGAPKQLGRPVYNKEYGCCQEGSQVQDRDAEPCTGQAFNKMVWQYPVLAGEWKILL